ncbi:MAG: hypothetical protein QOJ89_4067 [bacterium]|jgi:hypothetical protein
MARRRRVTFAAAATAVLLAGASAHTAAQGSAASEYADPVDAGSRVDLAGARLEQVEGGELALEIDTHAPWDPADVNPSATRALCVWLRNELSPTPGGRLCVVPDARAASGLHLRLTGLDHLGRRGVIRELSPVVQRPSPTTISARVEPALLRLVPGRYRWQLRSRSHGIDDRLPDAGELTLSIALSTAPAARERCFAAAARDPLRPCENPALRRAVVPTPDDAILTTNSPCAPLHEDGDLKPCGFGVAAADAQASIALVGDSHAAHWRGALEQVAQDKRWTGISITTSGCPLSRATPTLEPRGRRAKCGRWNAQLPGWFARHPEIHTVFASQHSKADVVAPPGRDRGEIRVSGYRVAWRALPRSVRRIVVLRDTPLLGFQNACVRGAIARQQNAGDRCALARGRALGSDDAVVAARRMRSRRVRVIDMTRFFCTRRRCEPVIGGALVFKDSEHMTDVFSTSLGPYLRRAIDAL